MYHIAETLIDRHLYLAGRQARRSKAEAGDLIYFQKITFGEGFAVPDFSGMTL